MSGTARPGSGRGPSPGPEDQEQVRAARRRRHRRVDAPPTNPEADPADDVPAVARPAPAQEASETQVVGTDPREAWIRAQRPPHWD